MTTELVANEWLNSFLLFLIYLSSSLILLFIGKWAFKLRKNKINFSNELVEKDNLAFSFAYVGYFAGLILAVGSAIYGESNGLLVDLVDMGIFGLLAILLLNLSSTIMDKITLSKFSIWKEITEDRNAGMGIIEGANYLGSGLIIFGAITGESGNLLFGIYTALLYWVLGQVLILISTALYNKLVPYDIHEEIEKDNVAAGIAYAGLIIAMANLIRNGLMGNFDNWVDTLMEVGYEAGIGIIILPLIRTLVDKILLPGQNLSDEIANQETPNSGAALIEALGYIGGSMLIIWCI
ncbi:MAG: DUF350 domain-containing protein [Bacteroidetes bacterium]|nr:MAG: DUF350 domain-containing protein [Bacteroidota bacterium]